MHFFIVLTKYYIYNILEYNSDSLYYLLLIHFT